MNTRMNPRTRFLNWEAKMLFLSLFVLNLSPHATRGIDIEALKNAPLQRLGAGSLTTIAFSPDGHFIASSSWDTGKFLLWDTQTLKLVERPGTISNVYSIAFSPDGTHLAIGYLDNTIRLMNLDTLALLPGSMISSVTQIGISGVEFSPDGNTLVSTGYGTDGVLLWDVSTQQQILRFQSGKRDRAIAISPDGKYLVTGGIRDDLDLRVWSIETGDQIHTLTGHKATTRDLAFSPDGSLLASSGGSGDNAAYLWDMRTWEQVGVLGGHPAHVGSVAFSADGTHLATTSYWANYVYIWDAQTHRRVATLTGHDASDIGWDDEVIFSSDGKWLASMGDNGIELWGPLKSDPILPVTIGGRLIEEGQDQYLRLEWPSQVGAQYALQFKERVSDTEWTSVKQLAGTGEVLTEDFLIDHSTGFYRIMETPDVNAP